MALQATWNVSLGRIQAPKPHFGWSMVFEAALTLDKHEVNHTCILLFMKSASGVCGGRDKKTLEGHSERADLHQGQLSTLLVAANLQVEPLYMSGSISAGICCFYGKNSTDDLDFA